MLQKEKYFQSKTFPIKHVVLPVFQIHIIFFSVYCMRYVKKFSLFCHLLLKKCKIYLLQFIFSWRMIFVLCIFISMWLMLLNYFSIYLPTCLIIFLSLFFLFCQLIQIPEYQKCNIYYSERNPNLITFLFFIL